MGKKLIEGKDVDGNDTVVYVITPDDDAKLEAEVVQRKTFAKLINDVDEDGKSTAILKSRLYEYAVQQGLWNDQKAARERELAQEILDKLFIIKEQGGIKLSDARKIAIEISDLRAEMAKLQAPLSELKRYTVESQCVDESFDFLLTRCIRDEEGDYIFNSIKEYRNSKPHPWLLEACRYFSKMYYGLEDDWEKKLPENEFLIKYKLVDEDLNFIDKEGNKVDRYGNLVDDAESEKVEMQPFLDDDDNPILK